MLKIPRLHSGRILQMSQVKVLVLPEEIMCTFGLDRFGLLKYRDQTMINSILLYGVDLKACLVHS